MNASESNLKQISAGLAKNGIKVVFVCGPTASGKTGFAIRLAQELDGEIINADSRQIYKHMDIGTNKGKLTPNGAQEQIFGFKLQEFTLEDTTVKGWMFDLINPDQNFNVSHYRRITMELINRMYQQGKTAVITGGSGLYIDSLIRNYQFLQASPDQKLREKLEEYSVDELFDLLWEQDRSSAEQLNDSDMFNRRRLIRLLEAASQDRNNIPAVKEFPFAFEIFYPLFEREKLYQKINRRVEEMFKDGLVEETRKLIEMGYENSRPLQGIGYKEVLLHLEGKIDHQECVRLIQQAHRNYAARQITWFEGEGRGYNLTRVKFTDEII